METLKTVKLFDGYSLVQSKDAFPLTQDSVLLSDFARLKSGERGIDLGCGIGCLGVLILLKNEGEMDGVDISPDACSLAEKNYTGCGVHERGRIRCLDLRELRNCARYDVCVSNPPYFKQSSGYTSKSDAMAAARNGLSAGTGDVIAAAGRLLKTGGRLYLCQKPEALEDVLLTLHSNSFSAKSLRFVHQKANSPANLVMIEARFQSAQGCEILPPLLVTDDTGNYSEQYNRIYRR